MTIWNRLRQWITEQSEHQEAERRLRALVNLNKRASYERPSDLPPSPQRARRSY